MASNLERWDKDLTNVGVGVVICVSPCTKLRARGGSTAAACTSFFYRSIQLSTTTIFCRFLKKCCTIKYCISFLNSSFWVLYCTETDRTRTLEAWFSQFQVVCCTDFGQQPRNKSRWAVVSPLGPRRRAAEKYHGGALALDESRAAPVRSGWARVPHRGRGNGRKVLRWGWNFAE